MRIKPGFSIREICGQNIVIAEGKENLDFSDIVSMNESSSLLWKELQGKDFTAEDMAQILMDNCCIDEDTPLPKEKALKDAEELIKIWDKIGFLDK
jgi:hypothetical protein